MKQISKRLFGAILAIVMLISIVQNGIFKVSATNASTQGTYATGDIVTFGSYPQTKVMDTETINALNLLTRDSNGDATYNSMKYRRVYFEQYTPCQTNLSSSAENSYQDDNGYHTGTVYWFKYEPIQWRVLSNTNGELFVVAENILDSRAYNQVNCGVTWETCTLRNWLNNSFYSTAFTTVEQTQVKTSDIVNPDNASVGTEGGNNTADKLFLLSYDETLAAAYGFDSNPTTRQAQGTDFSKSNGLYVYSGNYYNGNSYWWSRSPGSKPEEATDVNNSGGYYNDNVNYSYTGVRPAMSFSPVYETPFNITFDANGGTGGTSTSIAFGSALYPPTVARAGWTFTGWSPTVPATVPAENVTYTAQWVNNRYAAGDIISFGSYPQSRVSNSYTINVLNSLTYDTNGDVTYDGAKYRRVYFITANSNQHANGYYANTVYWFKYEPIQWRVWSNTNGVFVIADKILDSRAYNQVNCGVTWETCTLRSWLNNDFYNIAFSSTEKDRISSSEVISDNDPYYGTFGGNNTNDNIFVLSISEVSKVAYGFSHLAGLRAQGSDFSKSNGLTVFSTNSRWWLRTPGGDQSCVCGIDGNGNIIPNFDDFGYGVNDAGIGTRPAFNYNPDSEIFASATVTFDANGGTGGTSGSMNCGAALSAPTVTRTGYTFTGWSPSVPSTVPEADTTYTAQWSQNTYNIIFNANGGESGTSVSMLYGTALSAPTVTRAGYIFMGWSPAVPATVPAEDATFTAQWITENSSTITFDANGGTGGTSKTIEIGSELTAPAVARTGYTFVGWLPQVPTTVPETDKTYTAQWTTNTYTITYNNNSGTGGTTADSIHTYDVVANLTTNGFTKTGFTFLGWSTSSSATTPTFGDAQSMLNLTSTNGEMITFYAVWQVNNYLITFDANGGTGGTSALKPYGAALSAPAVTRRGYTFAGWSPNVPATVPAENVTYTAQWRGNGYIVGDSITFGSYPQAKVTSSATVNALNSLVCDANGDVTYGGAKYKKECFTRYTSYNTSGVQNAANSYQDDNGYYTNTVYWFKYEPIRWRVLSSGDDDVFMVAEKVLDSKAYNQTDSATTWESCSLRSWLNNDFFNTAFSSTEKVQIVPNEVANNDNPYFGTEGGNNTTDNLFLISFNEVSNPAYGFDSSFSTYDSARQTQGTDFAKSHGLMVYPTGSYAGNCLWRLRSPGCEPNYTGDVYSNGVVGSGDFDYATGTYTGVRPALKLKIIVFNQKCTAQVDTESGFITNLTAGGTTVSKIKRNIVSSNIRLVDKNGIVLPDSSIIGTGSKVQLFINSNTVIDELTTVIYGDVTGDGNIDSIDAGNLVDYENYMINWDPATDAAQIKAGDLNGDGNVDSIDAGIAVDSENYMLTIDQSTGLAT